MIVNCKHRFLLHKRGGKTENLRLLMRVTIKGKKPVDISLPCNVDLKDWDADSQRVRRSVSGGDSINRTIEEYSVKLADVIARYEYVDKRVPEPQELKELFIDEMGGITQLQRDFGLVEPKENSDDDVYKVLIKYLCWGETTQCWSVPTIRCTKSSLKCLFFPKKKLLLSDISEGYMNKVYESLVRRGYKNVSIHDIMAKICGFITWCAKEGYYTGDKLTLPRIKGTSVKTQNIIYLTKEELRMVMEINLSKSRAMSETRDFFVFCCFTGLRFSDAWKLKKADCTGNVIRVVTQKTSEVLNIELNQYSREILNKYADSSSDLALPSKCLVTYNEQLKTIAKLCGIDYLVTKVYYVGGKRMEETKPKYEFMASHVARRTFVVTALQLGIPAEVIMKWTGHSSFEAMKPYFKIVDELKAEAMAKFNAF